MKNFTPELIREAKTAKSAEDLLSLAKENNVEMTEEEAKTYFEQLNANGAVSDDELGAVAGGGFLGLSCPSEDEAEEKVVKKGTNARTCPHCGATIYVRPGPYPCPKCGKTITNDATSYLAD
jgi:rubrerythrin